MKSNSKISINNNKTQKPVQQTLSQTIVKKEDPKIKELQDKLTSATSELSRLKITLDNLTSENEKLKTNTGESTSSGPIRAFPGSEMAGKTNKESLEQIAFLLKNNEELSIALKVLRSDHKKLQNSQNAETDKTTKLTQTIAELEKELKESQEKNEDLNKENNKLKETLKNTENTLKQKEKYIDVLVKNNSGRLNLEDELKLGDAPKRDSMKRNSIATGLSGLKKI